MKHLSRFARWTMVPASLAGAMLLLWRPGARGSLFSVAEAAAEEARQASSSPAASTVAANGCMSCHTRTDAANGHESPAVRMTCVDCHGGNAAVALTPGTAPGSEAYEKTMKRAHVAPRHPSWWKSSANPVRSYTRLNQESLEFIRFMNPGDLRVAREACGTAKCHPREVAEVPKSMMTHGAMLWEAALYNNGAYPFKDAVFGEFYTKDGRPAMARTLPPPTPEETARKGVLPYLLPLPRWEISQPGNILRVFERGGVPFPETGNPGAVEENGRPDDKLSFRGFGTLLRTDPVFLGLQKTRLLDPTLNFLGTNDHPGEYRSSGCTACHMIYANDRDPTHSGPYARFGHLGMTGTVDPTIPRDERGHPIHHALTLRIPSSQCMVCHVHPGTNVVNAYYGTMWWDNETDGQWLYPAHDIHRSAREIDRIQQANPEAAALRGLWGDEKFLESVRDLNPKLQHTQFADFNGHGWIFRNVYWHDDKGNFLDKDGKIVDFSDPKKFEKALHLTDIHLDKGMQCVDCHFARDNHGDGKLYGETRAAVEIRCVDCHGGYDKPTTLVAADGTDLNSYPTAFGPRFQKRRGKVYQQSAVDPKLKWEIVQTVDTINPASEHYNERSRLAKTIQSDGTTWGAIPDDQTKLAHMTTKVSCAACHTSWVTSCFGCHLPLAADRKKPMLHNEGENTRNWTAYSFQTLRDDVFMLGHDSTVHGNDVTTMRSSCAVLVDSQNANRDWVYAQQQTISAGGLAGTAFSSFYSHTIRGGMQTKFCTDCHLSKANDNNAKMAQLLMLGTNFYNFIGRYCYVAEGRKGFDAVAVTEFDEPQAVYGSFLHKIAYPDEYRKFEARGRKLEAYHHRGHDIRSLQLRGEYLYTASGSDGLVVYDVANIHNKSFSQHIQTAPVSPLGQRLYVRTKDATAVASPSTMALDPTRQRFAQNEEPPVHPMYGYLYVTDRVEGLILVPAATLLDGDPTNNFLKREATFNPDGKLTGANNITIVGTYAYVTTDHGLEVVSLQNVPKRLRIVAEIGAPTLNAPHSVAVQFRYAFVCDKDGVKVLDVTNLAEPKPTGTVIRGLDAYNVYLARTYAYVAAGSKGLAIFDIQNPLEPKFEQVYNAGGTLNDTRDVKLGMTNNSLYAYVADGRNGLKVLEVMSPDITPGIYGFSPHPTPRLIATFRTRGPALAISKGLDRDRAVDESGNQLAVFGRRGARPFDLSEMYRMYLHGDVPWAVSDQPPSPAQAFRLPAKNAGKADLAKAAAPPATAQTPEEGGR